MQTAKEALDRCGHISIQPLEDSLLFGPRNITDPETGNPIPVQGYDIDANQNLLSYIVLVADTFERYYDCVDDLFFFELIFSPETYPEFPENKHLSQYLKVNYHNWLIKIITAYDCTLQALNSVFELGIPGEKVSRKTFASKMVNLKNSSILSHAEKLDQVLNTVFQDNPRSKAPASIRLTRNKLIHTYEFEHSFLSDLHADIGLSGLGVLDIDAFDLQARIGSTGMEVKQEAKKINLEILKQVYPIFEYLNLEYQKRFKEKLIQ